MSDDRVTNVDAAALAGVAASTWRDYVARGYAPAPDGRLGRTPWWHRDTITTWLVTRPGQGTRTDLQADPTTDTMEDRPMTHTSCVVTAAMYATAHPERTEVPDPRDEQWQRALDTYGADSTHGSDCGLEGSGCNACILGDVHRIIYGVARQGARTDLHTSQPTDTTEE